MLRGPLASPDFRGHFSGHETFTLRYGWLNKIFDAVSASQHKNNASLFSRDEAIADFGVGKNMVSSMKHWGLATGIIAEADTGYCITRLGNLLMGEQGLDPYLEFPAALWLIHWNIASNPKRTTTWYWAFGYYSGLVFDQDRLTSEIAQLCSDRGWDRVAQTTIKRDVECFVRTYATSSRRSSGDVTEDSLESPLAELALIKPTGFRGNYQFQRGPKPSLPNELFVYALDKFWRGHTSSATLSVEAISYEPGSPGRVFKLDEDSIVERLTGIDQSSGGSFQWTDTAGLRQVLRTDKKYSESRILRRAFTPSEQLKDAA